MRRAACLSVLMFCGCPGPGADGDAGALADAATDGAFVAGDASPDASAVADDAASSSGDAASSSDAWAIDARVEPDAGLPTDAAAADASGADASSPPLCDVPQPITLGPAASYATSAATLWTGTSWLHVQPDPATGDLLAVPITRDGIRGTSRSIHHVTPAAAGFGAITASWTGDRALIAWIVFTSGDAVLWMARADAQGVLEAAPASVTSYRDYVESLASVWTGSQWALLSHGVMGYTVSRFDGTGAPLGVTPLPDSRGIGHAALGWNGRELGVAWMVSGDLNPEIHLIRIGSDGTAQPGIPIDMHEPRNFGSQPMLLSDGEDWITAIAWEPPLGGLTVVRSSSVGIERSHFTVSLPDMDDSFLSEERAGATTVSIARAPFGYAVAFTNLWRPLADDPYDIDYVELAEDGSLRAPIRSLTARSRGPHPQGARYPALAASDAGLALTWSEPWFTNEPETRHLRSVCSE